MTRRTSTAATLACAITLLSAGVGVTPATAQALLTQDEALALAFPEASGFERRTAFLTAEQARRVEERTGSEPDGMIVTYYLAMQEETPIGVAYFDVHRVRTLNEVLMVALGSDDRIVRVEVVAFSEPPDYKSPEGWLALFMGRGWEDDLSMKGDVPNMTGATLTTRAAKGAVGRVLALHHVIDPMGKGGR
ncbi:MAG: FMN-binding protein [Gemmatimonadetes bacterium]|nr:FMN-binding protein [Gemmatimonadota bacterium]